MHYMIIASAFVVACYAVQSVYARSKVYRTTTIEKRKRH
jgi:hypothetical protein